MSSTAASRVLITMKHKYWPISGAFATREHNALQSELQLNTILFVQKMKAEGLWQTIITRNEHDITIMNWTLLLCSALNLLDFQPTVARKRLPRCCLYLWRPEITSHPEYRISFIRSFSEFPESDGEIGIIFGCCSFQSVTNCVLFNRPFIGCYGHVVAIGGVVKQTNIK